MANSGTRTDNVQDEPRASYTPEISFREGKTSHSDGGCVNGKQKPKGRATTAKWKHFKQQNKKG